ncbi:MAG: AAA family ATPase [Patescibacteria group bacterium]
MIIGLTGTFGAGKDAVSEYLAEKGFEHISTSDILREVAKERSLGLDRETVRMLSNNLKKEFDSAILAKMAVEQKSKKNLVISALRDIGEIDYLKTIDNFKLIFVDAPIEIRYERLIKRSRDDQEKKLTLEELKEKEQLEMSGKSSQRIDLCKEKADYIIDNSGTIEGLNKKIDKILENIS